MLNKNQSSKWNSYKYLLIVPALAAFLFYFQVKVIAQERSLNPMIVAAQEGIEVVVDKNTSDAELKAESERLKKEHGIKLKFSKVKRNNVGEIIAIKVDFKDANGKKGTQMFSGDQPIEPIRFYKDNDGAIGFTGKRFEFFTKNDNGPARGFAFSHGEGEREDEPQGEDFEFNFDFDVDSIMADQKIVVATRNGNKRTVVVNGREVTGAEADKVLADIDPIKIKSFARSKNGDDNIIISVNGDEIFTSEDLHELTGKALAEAKLAIAAARPDMERAKADMKRASVEIKRAKAEMKRDQHQMERDQLQMKRDQLQMERDQRSKTREIVIKARESHEKEIEAAQKEIEEARDEIRKAQEEIRMAREELAKQRAAQGK